ncbi:hypothetical protein [Naasia lichenicola]|uniref:Uncharacterized protein n=1 Tax=Naasia lichenicola TaxID=2565933 RepID=A0A4S4FR66_9MICO|nr:hypothetical protein [Naasia lichenicola]THG30689.1 hypothetical protein E6C64_08595 [Naasia lichenicola]THG31926.1 hypothetical protein E6C64_07740 [Naasia lichenicola]
MGSNKRYGEQLQTYRSNKAAELRTALPISLTPAQLDFEHDPIKPVTAIYEVSAWMAFDDGRIAKVFGQARERTSRAVHVHWGIGDGNYRDAWVWAAAVERL